MPTRLLPAILSVLLLLAPALAAKPKREPCPPGRFVVEGAPLAAAAAATPDAVVFGQMLSIASGCAPARIKPKATKRGTKLKARWKSCQGIAGKATFQATIEPTCGTMRGTFRAKKAKLKRTFTATRGSCGDGIVDAGAGEACEGSGPCTGGTCNPTSCTCVPDQAGNTPPTAAFTSAADTIAAGTPLAFDGSGSSDPDGDALAYLWSFGDGGRGGAAQLAHVFAAPGSATVVLIVADGRGGTATAQRTITVTAGTAPVGTVVADGVVRTTGGMPLAGVAVELQGGGASAVTAGDGTVSVTIPRGVPATLRLAKDGYAEQTVVVQTPPAAESAIFQAEMLARGAMQMLDAAAGGSLAGEDGTRLTLPPNGLVMPNGQAAAGSVGVQLSPVDPTSDPDAFPGMFEGVTPAAEQGLLLSYGTVEFHLEQNGQPLDLAPGQRATIEIPFYGNADVDGSPIAVGDAVPLWSLDPQTGMWVQEGIGTVVASATSPTGFALRGEVGHFSWWNSDLFDSPPYQPKPKCCVDTDYDGECEDLSNTGYCWHYGTGPEQGGPGTFGAFADPPRLPQYAAEIMLPLGGGTVLPVPADYDVTLRSSALAGTYVGTTTLRGAGGVNEEVTVYLYPANGDVTPITVPWDQIYDIAPTETDRYVVTVAAGDPVYVRVSRSGSDVSGNVFVDGPGSNDLGPTTFGGAPANLGFIAAVAGPYFINVEGTNETGSYRLEVQPTGSFPLVLSTTPANGAQGLGVNTTVSATFTADIDPSSVTAFSFEVEQADDEVVGTRQTNGATVTFTPSAPLAPGAPFTVTLGTGLQAVGGTGLPTPVTFGFSTVDTIGPLTPLAAADRPAITALPNGEAMVVFEDDDGAQRGTAASRYVPGGGWSAPTMLRPSNDALGQTIAANAAGQAIAVYRQRASGAQPWDVWASHWTSAGGWGTPVSIESTTTSLDGFGNLSGDFQGLEIEMDAAGNAIAIFSENNQKLWWNRFTAGVGWGTAAVLVDVTTGALLESPLAMNADGVAFLAWTQTSSGVNSVQARRFTPGGGWEDAEPIAATFSPVEVGVDGDGNALVLWRESGFWRTRRWDDGDATWAVTTTPVQADSGDFGLAADNDVRLMMQDDGSAMAGGHATDGVRVIWAAAYTPGAMGTAGTWGTPAILDTIAAVGGAELTVNAAGKALMLWTGIFTSDQVRWKTFRPGVGWDASSGTLSPVEEQNLPHGAVAADGSLFAVTTAPGTTVATRVVAARLE